MSSWQSKSLAIIRYVHIIDNEGEDYLYPADYFVFVEFPPEVEQALLRVLKEKQEKVKGALNDE